MARDRDSTCPIFTPTNAKEILPLGLALVFLSCVDLSEVGRFAALSRNAKTAFPALVADIQNSCDRRADYAPERAREDVLLHCKNLGTSRDGLLEAQQVLLDYMDALKNLSSDNTFDYGKTLTRFQILSRNPASTAFRSVQRQVWPR